MRSEVQLLPGPPFAAQMVCLWEERGIAAARVRACEGFAFVGAGNRAVEPTPIRVRKAERPPPLMRRKPSLRMQAPALEAKQKRGLSSAGRAVALQASGHRFDPDRLHHISRMKIIGLPALRR